MIVTSAHTRKTLIEDFGVAPSRVTVALPGTAPASRASGSGGGTILLAVGSIIARKGFDILVEALAGLARLDWRLRLVGGAPAPETANALARLIEARGLGARIDWLGEVSAEALDGIYDSSDIFVSSSLYEGYGMALAEALARGLPIVTTTGGACADTAPDGAALKVAPGDVDALREALRRMIEDRDLRRDLSEASWRAGQQLPSWRDTARTIGRAARAIAPAVAGMTGFEAQWLALREGADFRARNAAVRDAALKHFAHRDEITSRRSRLRRGLQSARSRAFSRAAPIVAARRPRRGPAGERPRGADGLGRRR